MTLLFPTTPPLGMRHPLSLGCLSGEEANQSLSILLPSPGFQISQERRIQLITNCVEGIVCNNYFEVEIALPFSFSDDKVIIFHEKKVCFLFHFGLTICLKCITPLPYHHQGGLDFSLQLRPLTTSPWIK